MAQGSSRSLALLLGALGTLVPMQGCVDDGVSFHVICPIIPTLDDEGCTWDPASTVCLIEGVLNLRSGSNYNLTVRVESGLKARDREVPPRGEPNGMQVTKARVELRTADGKRISFAAPPNFPNLPSLPNPFESVATGYLPPGGTSAVSFDAIPSDYSRRLLISPADLQSDPGFPQVIAAVQLKGKTDGDLHVESGEYLWPIRLTNRSLTEIEGICAPVEYCPNLGSQDGFANVCR